MNIIDVVAYEPEKTGYARDENMLVWRWPSNKLTLGTQLIVNQSQEAIFFKGGQALDIFGPGTHTLAADNLPIIHRLVNLPFGGNTPFTAEVYFVNKHAKLDMKWGTADPFRITDPVYHIIVPVRSFGQLGIRVADARSFVTQLVGTLHEWHSDKVSNYFKGLVTTHTKNCIAKFIVDNNISVMDIASNLQEISSNVNNSLVSEFARFGIEIINFYVMSINVPDDDQSVIKIQEIMASRAEFEQLGSYYKIKRTFDTLEKAAQNEGGAAGAFLSGGLGAGMGIGAGAAIGANLGALLSTDDKATDKSTSEGNQPNHEDRLIKLKALLDKGLITESEFNEKRKRIVDEI